MLFNKNIDEYLKNKIKIYEFKIMQFINDHLLDITVCVEWEIN